jgi:hypothetical protein
MKLFKWLREKKLNHPWESRGNVDVEDGSPST